MNLQTEINELKAELNELNRLKLQEASELADIEYDIYQMESNFLLPNNPLRPLIIKGFSLTPDKSKVFTNKENINIDLNRIFTKSSLTSKLALNKLTSTKVKHATSQIEIKQENEQNHLKTSTSLPLNIRSENNNFERIDLTKLKQEEMTCDLKPERRASLRRNRL